MTSTYIQLSDGSYAEQTVPVVLGSAADSTSLSDTTTASAPVAGTTLATITTTTPGTYDVECFTFIGGTTVAATEVINMRLRVNTSAIGRIVNPVPGTSGATDIGQLRARVKTTAASDTINIVAVSNATAGSQYTACLVARRVA